MGIAAITGGTAVESNHVGSHGAAAIAELEAYQREQSNHERERDLREEELAHILEGEHAPRRSLKRQLLAEQFRFGEEIESIAGSVGEFGSRTTFIYEPEYIADQRQTIRELEARQSHEHSSFRRFVEGAGLQEHRRLLTYGYTSEAMLRPFDSVVEFKDQVRESAHRTHQRNMEISDGMLGVTESFWERGILLADRASMMVFEPGFGMEMGLGHIPESMGGGIFTLGTSGWGKPLGIAGSVALGSIKSVKAAVRTERAIGASLRAEATMLHSLERGVAEAAHAREVPLWSLQGNTVREALNLEGHSLTLTFKEGMNLRDFDRKVRALQDLAQRGKLVKSEVVRDVTIQAEYRRNLLERAKCQWGEIEPARVQAIEKLLRGLDADHFHDLQLGGFDHISALWMLNKSVNRSLGAQIQAQLKNVPVGTKITKVVIQ